MFKKIEPVEFPTGSGETVVVDGINTDGSDDAHAFRGHLVTKAGDRVPATFGRDGRTRDNSPSRNIPTDLERWAALRQVADRLRAV